MNKRMLGVVLSLFSTIGLSTIVFHILEDWTWIQSFYFSVVTLTTVGYGDLAPTTDGSRLAATGFILVGVVIVLSGLAAVNTAYVQAGIKRRKRK